MNFRPALSLLFGMVAISGAQNALACDPQHKTTYFEDRAPENNFRCVKRIVLPRGVETKEVIACTLQYTVEGINGEKYAATYRAACGRNQANISGAASEGAEEGGLFFFLTGPAAAAIEGISSANINSKIGKAVTLACDNEVETLKQLACDEGFEIVKPGTTPTGKKTARKSPKGNG